jgi:alkylhydroperoxidase family enzyme
MQPSVPYPNVDADEARRSTARLVANERDGELLNLYRMLLHSPKLAVAWLELGSQLRFGGALPDRVRELVICHVGTRSRCDYELHHHAALALNAGVEQAQLDALSDWSRSSLFDRYESDLLAYVDATIDGTVSRDVLDRMLRHLKVEEVVELTALVSYYRGVSYFVKALAIPLESAP